MYYVNQFINHKNAKIILSILVDNNVKKQFESYDNSQRRQIEKRSRNIVGLKQKRQPDPTTVEQIWQYCRTEAKEEQLYISIST